MSTPDVWGQFPRDPRHPAYAPLRASDADREVVLHVLGEAYADGRLDRGELDERSDAVHGARTLGELPGHLTDLIPVSGPVASQSVALSPDDVEQQARARWERSRREALLGFLIPTLCCWAVWMVFMTGGFPWPVFPMIGTAVPLLSTLVQKQDMIASNKQVIVSRHEKELRSRRTPPEPA